MFGHCLRHWLTMKSQVIRTLVNLTITLTAEISPVSFRFDAFRDLIYRRLDFISIDRYGFKLGREITVSATVKAGLLFHARLT